jgi:hypothetical protein
MAGGASRRVSLPTADDLFRPTGDAPVRAVPDPEVEDPAHDGAQDAQGDAAAGKPGNAESGPKSASGRIRHDEKMTVYVTADELLDIEHARLSMRRNQGLAVDRGRLVREAIALALIDFEEHGEDSALVRRLLAE